MHPPARPLDARGSSSRSSRHSTVPTARLPATIYALTAPIEMISKVRSDPSVILRTVLADGAVAGHAAVFGPPSEREVTYVIGRAHWGQGIATGALAELIKLEPTRPLHADAAADNAGSIRVLEKCGFVVTGKSRCFARAREQDIDLVHLTLG
ncbi:GNAT family N-acetyltransferase [Streptomyces griseoincarnatus]